MASLKATRGAQWVLQSEFVFDMSTAVNDAMPTVVGNVIGGATPVYNAAVQPLSGLYGGVAQIYELMNLPPSATVVGGEISVDTAVVGPSASTLSIGDLNSGSRYGAAINLQAVGRTALTLTGYRGVGENIRGSLANSGAAATAGKVTVRVQYTMLNRQNEVQPV